MPKMSGTNENEFHWKIRHIVHRQNPGTRNSIFSHQNVCNEQYKCRRTYKYLLFDMLRPKCLFELQQKLDLFGEYITINHSIHSEKNGCIRRENELSLYKKKKVCVGPEYLFSADLFNL